LKTRTFRRCSTLFPPALGWSIFWEYLDCDWSSPEDRLTIVTVNILTPENINDTSSNTFIHHIRVKNLTWAALLNHIRKTQVHMNYFITPYEKKFMYGILLHHIRSTISSYVTTLLYHIWLALPLLNVDDLPTFDVQSYL
jgi:hypothetical protein